MKGVYIRWMVSRDLDRVCEIEAASFECPWLRSDFVLTLRQRNCIGMVALRGDEIVGYVIYSIHRNRIEILNLAVPYEHRRQGVGRQIVERLIDKLSPDRRTKVYAVVAERNVPAQLFMRAMGFRATQTLKDYYEASEEQDAYKFEYHLKEQGNG